jgi:putative tricarboxylic transport membrane protein
VAYLQAAKENPGKFKMGGTGTAQEDQIITVQLEQGTGAKFICVPFKGGGEVAANLVGKHVDLMVNNPNEAMAHWKAGRLHPLGDRRCGTPQPARLAKHPDHEGAGV